MAIFASGPINDGGRVRVTGRILVDAEHAQIDPRDALDLSGHHWIWPPPDAAQPVLGATVFSIRLVGLNPADLPDSRTIGGVLESWATIEGIWHERQVEVTSCGPADDVLDVGAGPRPNGEACGSTDSGVRAAVMRHLADRRLRWEVIALAEVRVRRGADRFRVLASVTRITDEIAGWLEAQPPDVVEVRPWLAPTGGVDARL